MMLSKFLLRNVIFFLPCWNFHWSQLTHRIALKSILINWQHIWLWPFIKSLFYIFDLSYIIILVEFHFINCNITQYKNTRNSWKTYYAMTLILQCFIMIESTIFVPVSYPSKSYWKESAIIIMHKDMRLQ